MVVAIETPKDVYSCYKYCTSSKELLLVAYRLNLNRDFALQIEMSMGKILPQAVLARSTCSVKYEFVNRNNKDWDKQRLYAGEQIYIPARVPVKELSSLLPTI